MTGTTRSRLSDLKVIGLIVSITIGIATVAWSVVSWATSVVTIGEATEAHSKIEAQAINDKVELQLEDSEIDKKADAAIEEVKQVGRDVKTVKCILLAPNRQAKARCALEQ